MSDDASTSSNAFANMMKKTNKSNSSQSTSKTTNKRKNTSSQENQSKLPRTNEEIIIDDEVVEERINKPPEELKEITLDKFTMPFDLVGHYEYSYSLADCNEKIVKTVLKCILCSKEKKGPKGNFHNFREHLKVHDIIVTPLSTIEKKSENNKQLQQSMSNFLGKPSVQKMKKNDNRQLRVDKALSEMIATDSLPLNIVSGRGFKKFVSVLDPTVNIKSRPIYRKKINEEAERIKQNFFGDELKKLTSQRIHFIIDIWSTKSNEAVLGIKVQYMNDDFIMKNKTISFIEFGEAHSGVNIREKVVLELESKGISTEQIGIIISDNASNMLKAFNMQSVFNDKWDVADNEDEDEDEIGQSDFSESEDDSSESNDDDDDGSDEQENLDEEERVSSQEDYVHDWSHHGCLAHKAQLIVNKILKKHAKVQNCVQMANKIIKLFRRSVKWTYKLKLNTHKKILAPNQTRWNSLLRAIKRINEDEVFPHIIPVLEEYNSQCKKSHKKIPVPSQTDKRKMNELCDILKPFQVLTDQFQGNGITSSSVIKWLLDVQTKLMKQECVYFDAFRKALLAEMDTSKRFKDIMMDEKFVIATILDPRYKLKIFAPKANNNYFKTPTEEEAEKVLSTVFEKYSSPEIPDCPESLSSQQDTLFEFLSSPNVFSGNQPKSELKEYLDEAVLPLERSKDGKENFKNVIEYWKRNSERFPTLVKLVKIYLAIPASSGDVERLFSIAGALKRQRRNRLKLKLIENMLLIKDNI